MTNRRGGRGSVTDASGGVVLSRLALSEQHSAVSGLYVRGGVVSTDSSGERKLRVAAGETADLGTWFNAAPTGWWRQILGIDQIALRVAGRGCVEVYRSGRSGTAVADIRQLGSADAPGSDVIYLPVCEAVDWYWITVTAIDGPGELSTADWVLADDMSAGDVSAVPALTVVVPTFRREQDVGAQLERLFSDDLVGLVGHVIVVDQGGSVRGHAAVAAILAAHGDAVTVIEQDNLGGSGGYARGMAESLAHPDDAVLLLDDDAVIEPEGLRRMVTLQSCACRRGRRLIVGAPLLPAERPTSIIALAERVRLRDFDWRPADRLVGVQDLTASGPATWSFARPRARATYTGWWSTLLPPGTVSDIGVAAPYFIKWDDAEYGLRATRAGYHIATVPGTGSWHPSWAAKGTSATWASWPMHRNRLATAAAYGAGRGVLADSLIHQVKHVLSLQYDTAELWNAALAEFAAGPRWLRDGWQDSRDRGQQLLDRASVSAKLPPMPVQTTHRNDRTSGPIRLVVDIWHALSGLLRRNPSRLTRRVPAQRFTWRDGLGADVVILMTSDDTPHEARGTRPAGAERALLRDPKRARAILVRALASHTKAAIRWRSLRRGYRATLSHASTLEAWQQWWTHHSH